MKDKAFGNRLKRLRKLKNFKQEKAAPLIGVGYRSLQGHEAGRKPKPANLIKYLRFYRCNEAWLLTGQGHPFSGQETSLTYKGIEGGGQESQDKEGLFGKTRHIKVEGAGFAVTTHEPKNHNTDSQTIATLVEMLHTKERQLSEQTMKIENLEAECEAFKEKNDELKKRISTLKIKLLENNSRKEALQDPADDLGEWKAV